MAIQIVAYREEWPAEFAVLAAPLSARLGPLALRIDHIGSTSVPDLAAKDIIDMQVTVGELTDELDGALQSLGYTRRPDITADHRPPGTAGPDTDWKKWYYAPPPGQRPAHLHVRVAGRPNQRYPLLFRDYLRAHPPTRDAYALVKQHLARLHPDDVEAYYDIKDPVCDLIWQAAEAWADRTHWRGAD